MFDTEPLTRAPEDLGSITRPVVSQDALDFYAVTDHAMFLGAVRKAADTTTELSRFDFSEPLGKWASIVE